MKKSLIAAGLAFLLGSGVVYSQTISVPTLTTLRPFIDLIQVIPNGKPSAQSQYAPPALVTNVYGYYKSGTNAGAGFNYTFGANVTFAQFSPSGTIASGYVTLPANPSDGARACIFTTQTITAAYVAANAGQSINGALSSTSLSANTGACYLYGASNTTWDRD